MNQSRRKRIVLADRGIQHCIKALGEVYNLINDVCDEEKKSMDNTPENLVYSSRYEAIEQSVDALNDLRDQISAAQDELFNVVNKINIAKAM